MKGVGRVHKRLAVLVIAIGLIVGVQSGTAAAAGWPELNIGTLGTDVSVLQRFLGVRPDGQFGSGTRAAVIALQARTGLAVDGVVGAETWNRAVPLLQMGSSGSAVYALQLELNAKHHYGVAVDGVFGSSTRAVVRRFQSEHGLSADGVVGQATWRKLIGHFADLGAVSGPGWYHYMDDGYDDYASANAIAHIKKVASDWAKLGYGVRIGIGDESRPHGGYFAPHASHRDGLDMDLSCVLWSGEGGCDWRNAGYSRSRTQKLVDMLLATGQVDRILFNDPYVRGVTHAEGHDNHMHVDWKR